MAGFSHSIQLAEQAVKFFEEICRATRKAVDCWTLVGFRFGVVKDIRLLIAKLIWDTRKDKGSNQELVWAGKA